jgi:hypothetical protein
MNNIASTIIDVWDYKTGTLEILVNTEYAQSFRQFLTDKGIKCTPLSEAIFQGTKLYRDKDGTLQHEQPCTVHAFEVDCAPEDLRKWTDEWCLAIFYRKPKPN